MVYTVWAAVKHIATQALCTVQAQIGTGTFPHTGIALLLLHSSIQHPPSQEGRARWQPRQRTIKGKVYKQIILQACKQPSPRPRPERALGEGACFLSAFSKCGSAKSGHPWYSTVVFQQLLNTDSDGRASVNVFSDLIMPRHSLLSRCSSPAREAQWGELCMYIA